MPELPEVETTCRGIRPHIMRHTIADVIVRESRLRWPVPDNLSKLSRDARVVEVTRRAKYLLIKTTRGTLILHLGMSGSLRVLSTCTKPKNHDHIDIVFSNGCCLRFHDPRRFGAVLWTQDSVFQHPLLAELGPEPLSRQFSGNHLYQNSRRRKTEVKNFIMNAHVVVGVGNIYASEALFSAGIHPQRAAGRISRTRYESLSNSIKLTLKQAIEAGGTTLRDFLDSDGEPGYFATSLRVYDRAGEACVYCKTTIRNRNIGQRSSFYCPTCQR